MIYNKLRFFDGDKRAYPRSTIINCKTQFYNWLNKNI